MNARTAVLVATATVGACAAIHFVQCRRLEPVTVPLPAGSAANAPRPPAAAVRAQASRSPARRPPPDVISRDALRLAAADGSMVSYAERRKALGSLPQQLGDGDIALVTNFLTAAGSRIPGLSTGERLALKNDALDLLQRQERPVPGLSALLLGVLNDPGQQQGWRDYCLQALPSQYSKAPEEGGVEERRLVLDAFASVFNDPGKIPFRGTALRGIDNLSRDRPEVAKELGLDDRIRAVVSDPASDEPSLITALRMSADHHLTDTLGTVSNLAARGSSPLLRKVAEKTLADLNTAEK